MAMVVGILQARLTIDWAESLKDKRRVVRSLKDRLHREHQVSVAEVDCLDNCTVAMLGIALAASDGKYCRSTLDRIVDKLKVARDCVLDDYTTEILSGN